MEKEYVKFIRRGTKDTHTHTAGGPHGDSRRGRRRATQEPTAGGKGGEYATRRTRRDEHGHYWHQDTTGRVT